MNARSCSVISRHPLVVTVLSIILMALAGCGQGSGNAAPAAGGAASTAGKPPAMPVSILEAQRGVVPLRISVVGQAEGSKTVEIRARVTGVIQEIQFTEGSRIPAGAPMYRLEREPFVIALNQAQSGANQERARLDQARRQRERLRQLNAQNLISKREYDDALVAERTAEAAWEVAKSQVAEAELNLSYTLITAPIAGIAGRSQRSQGSLVNPGSTEPLTTLVSTDPVWVRFALSDAQLRSIGDPSQATVSLGTAGGEPLLGKGQLNYTGSTVDPQLGTVSMRATFANPSLALLPGQFVQVTVESDKRTAYLVPKVAVSQGEKGPMVWVLDSENRAQPRPVRAGEWRGDQWVIEQGLEPGNQVIVDNLMKLRPGALVAPKPFAPKVPPKMPTNQQAARSTS